MHKDLFRTRGGATAPQAHSCLGSWKGPEGSEEAETHVLSKDCLANLSLALQGRFSPWREARGSFPTAQLMLGKPGQEPVICIQGSSLKA